MMDAHIRSKYLDTFDRSGSRVITFEDYILGMSQILRSIKQWEAYYPHILAPSSEPRLLWPKERGPRKVLLIKKPEAASVTSQPQSPPVRLPQGAVVGRGKGRSYAIQFVTPPGRGWCHFAWQIVSQTIV